LPGGPNPRYQALQVPIFFQGFQVVDQDFVDNAKANGLAVHVWTIDDADEMTWLLSLGVNGIMTDVPSQLEKILKQTR
jgi:glycerophosphoryl diester phosphodiesterase